MCVCLCVCVCVYHMIAFNGGENTDPLGTLGLNKHDGEFLEFLFCFMYSRLGPKVGNLEIPIGTDKKKKKKNVLTESLPSSAQGPDKQRQSIKIDSNHSTEARH